MVQNKIDSMITDKYFYKTTKLTKAILYITDRKKKSINITDCLNYIILL